MEWGFLWDPWPRRASPVQGPRVDNGHPASRGRVRAGAARGPWHLQPPHAAAMLWDPWSSGTCREVRRTLAVAQPQAAAFPTPIPCSHCLPEQSSLCQSQATCVPVAQEEQCPGYLPTLTLVQAGSESLLLQPSGHAPMNLLPTLKGHGALPWWALCTTLRGTWPPGCCAVRDGCRPLPLNKGKG